MTLLDDLTSLDFSAVVQARANISASSGGLSISLEGGAAVAALGDLGRAIATLEASVDDPASLLRPLVDLLLELAGPLRQELPVGPWFEAVEAGVRLLLEIIEVLNGEPEGLLDLLSGGSGSAMVRQATRLVEDYTPVSGSRLTEFRQLVELVEGRPPSDPAALVDLAMRILQPFAGRPLVDLRAALDPVLTAAAAVDLPRTRLDGLRAALEAVISAANSGQAAQLEQALAALERVRVNTLNALRNDLALANTRIGRLPIEPLFAPLNAAGLALQTAEEGVLEFMGKWQQEIAAARTFLETADFDQVGALFETGLDLIEDTARQIFVEPIDEAVEKLKAWLRGLLAHLRLAEFRGEITDFLAAIARAIEEADLDGPALAARELFDDIESAISGDLVGSIQGAINDLKGEIDGFLQTVTGALTQITNEINAIAGQAQAVLERIAGVLEQFQQTINQITASIEQIGIEAATAQVVDTLAALRQTAEEVLKSVALPDSLRPTIDQLIAEIEAIDLDDVFEPAYQVADMNFEIPAEVTQGLDQVAEAIANLIPDELITSIEQEVSALLDVVREFDPTTLLAGVTEKIEEAAAAIRQIDPRPAVDSIRAPYVELLDLVDQAHPNRLLAPVIEAWDSLLGEVNLQSPQQAVGNLSGAINAAGERLAQQAVAPIQQMAPPGMLAQAEPGAAASLPPIDPATVLPVRPGDVVRMFGYLPNKLREFIDRLEAAAAESFLARLDGLGRGLAADLRALPEALMGIEGRILSAWNEMLLPIGPLQFSAQLAIEANFEAGEIDLSASLDAVAAVRPGRLRADMDRLLADTLGQLRRQVNALTTAAGGSLTYAVTRLEQNLLHGLTQDLDSFLAALDPEPLAVELDALVETALRRAPEALTEIQDEITAAFRRLEQIIRDLNPATLALKFLTVTEVLEEQINLLDPRRLAAELAEIHQAIKNVFLAYDPAIFAQELFEIVDAVAAGLEALDPAALLGDLADFDAILAQVEAAVPSQALAGIDSSLEAVGARIQALDPNALIQAINDLPDRLVEAISTAVEQIKAEILALLGAIKYASANASVSVQASASIG